MRKFLPGLVLALCTICTGIFAQQRNCGAEEHLQEMLQKDPKFALKYAEIQKQTDEYVANNISTSMVTGTVTIPVVFHIVHNGDAVGSNENLSTALVQAQLDQLNDDFRRQNSDANKVPSEFSGIAADFQIEFCLASVDPDGNPTDGIIRHQYSQSSWTRSQIQSTLKPQTIWDRDSYLNFWSVQFGGGDSNLLGYAQFPGDAANTDGVVCVYTSIGSITNPNPGNAVFNLGRTGTHEVGHWLNLRHIWGDDGSSCTGSDAVSDTPNQGGSYGGRPSYPQNSCGSSDMFMNYMDYVYDDAMFMFSEGQKLRSRAVLDGFRAPLLNSGGCGTPSTPTCSDGVQNGQETGVDCGGPDCAPCTTGCNDNEVTLSITLDNYPEETAWTITNDSGTTVASGGTYGSQPDGSTVTESLCLPNDCYTFTITDTFGDGICCQYGNGSYSLTGSDGTLASGGSFTTSESTDFCLGGPPAPTCSDGIQNGQETGVDCGGPDCAACPPTGGGDCVTIDFNTVSINSYGGNQDSGTSDILSSGALRIQNNAWKSISLNYTVTANTVLEFDFGSTTQGEIHGVGFDNDNAISSNRTFRLWGTQNWGISDFNDYAGSVGNWKSYTIPVGDFYTGSFNRLFFVADHDGGASNGNSYFRNVRIYEGSSCNSRTELDRSPQLEPTQIGLAMYPNPARDLVNITAPIGADYRIVDLYGRVVQSGDIRSNQLNVSRLSAGAYIMLVTTEEGLKSVKFIKQ